jgi:hypothetical protein
MLLLLGSFENGDLEVCLDECCDDIVVQDGQKPGNLSVISSCGS